MRPSPPHIALRFFRWFCHPDLHPFVEGDLMELYEERLKNSGKRNADLRFVIDVLMLFRPSIIRSTEGFIRLNNYAMFRNYCKVAWRNLFKNKGYSSINIGGLAIGMAVAMLIALWIHDELFYNTYHQSYNRIFKVMKKETHLGTRHSGDSQPFALATILRSSYGNYFKHVAMEVEWTGEHIIASRDKKFSQSGRYMEPEAPEILTLNMLYGNLAGLRNLNSIMLSASLAEKLFGDEEPIGKIATMDGESTLKVTGVYEDLPNNSEFRGTNYIVPFDLFYLKYKWAQPNSWRGGNVSIYVQTRSGVDFNEVSAIIEDAMLTHVDEERAAGKPALFLHPMSKWHLYSEFENGIPVMSDPLKFIWFYGIIGVFVLILGCINFVNLSTARSEKRAKEVGIRKTMGSLRKQLISQFLSESLLFAAFAFVLSIGLVQLILPWFNGVADKSIHILWANPWFWVVGILFTLFTALLAGSYPAFYLSAFKPVKVLKGTFRAGRFATIPRKVLVVFQFTISITLIIGTLIIYQQIQFAKNRPVGYSRDRLIILKMTTQEYNGKYDLLRSELLGTGVVGEMAGAGVRVTENQHRNNGFNWKGKAPAFDPHFNDFYVSHEFGNVVGWQLVDGRDFSREFASDLSGVLINESALKLMGLENPIGEVLTWERRGDKNYTILGVVKDMVRRSPFEPIPPSIFFLTKNLPWIHIKINPTVSVSEALPKIKTVFNELLPSAPFHYQFVDEEYAAKFRAEERIGKLAGFFAVLAILISCLGLFGLAAFVAEQRTKEIGIRKVLGASVANLWRMLSKDFLVLVILSSLIAIPIAYYFLQRWLQQYEYRTEISLWVLVVACIGAVVITLLTVSYQAVKAALMNPVNSLKTE